MDEPQRSEPVLIFDGRCGFCTRSVEWLFARVREPIRAIPWQSTDLSQWPVTEQEAHEAAWWIEPDGRRFGGHLAAARALIACGPKWAWLGWLMRIPPMRWLAALGYVIIAKNRSRLPGATPACKRREWNERPR